MIEATVGSERYPELAELIGGWFHQDFDLNGDTVDEIIRAFRAVTPPDRQKAVQAEISTFIVDHSENLDGAFEAIFQPDVTPATLSGSTRAFLEQIHDLLDAQEQK